MLPLGVAATQPDPYEALRRAPEAKAFAEFDGLRVVCVGRLIPSKSVETLLAAQHMLERDGKRCACLIVGEGPMRDSLQATAQAHRTSITVFVGSQPPSLVPSFMVLGNVLVLPSLSEGRGLVVVEAMQLGLPVVVSDIDGPRELVSDMETGLTFPGGDARALANCLMRLQDQPLLATRLGQNGQRSMREAGLTSDAIATQHCTLYAELLAQANSPASHAQRIAYG
jgi:glycosyltransferase involved in cell wall biosynthesis